MARSRRVSVGNVVYHVINRRVGRMALFEGEGDYLAFEKVLKEAVERFGMRVLSYCLMPNHWHLVIWPRRGGELSRFMQWVTVTHMRRWHANRKSAGMGPVYQGRFKSFPVQDDRHLRIVCRYVERNAVRAGLVKEAKEWAWGSMKKRGEAGWVMKFSDWPVKVASDWEEWVNRPQTDAEVEALRRSVNRGKPFGEGKWVEQTAKRLGLESSLRDPWRPRKKQRGASVKGT